MNEQWFFKKTFVGAYSNEKTDVDIKIKSSKTSPVIKRVQHPLMLAWACIVHKVEGLSLNTNFS